MAETQEPNNKQNNPGHGPLPPAPAKIENPHPETSGQTSPDEEGPSSRIIAKWTKILGVSTIILSLATFGTGIVLFFTELTLRDTLKQSRESSERQLRAYVGPVEAGVIEVTGAPKIQILIKNFGNTPALNVKAVTYHLVGDDVISQQWGNAVRTPGHDFGMMDPQHSYPMLINLEGFLTPEKLLALGGDKTTILHIKTTVEYSDVFDNGYFRTFTHYLNTDFIRAGVDTIKLHISPLENGESITSHRK